jgi:hypothetical protein
MPAAHRPDRTAPRPASPTGDTNGESPDPDPRAQSGALGLHRAWDRAAKVMSATVPPAK